MKTAIHIHNLPDMIRAHDFLFNFYRLTKLLIDKTLYCLLDAFMLIIMYSSTTSIILLCTGKMSWTSLLLKVPNLPQYL